MVAAAIALAVIAMVAMALPAVAEEATPSAPPPTFTITAPAFSSTNAVHFSGDKDAGTTVQVLSPTTGAPPLCTSADADTAGTTWSCIGALPSGGGITVTAEEDDATGVSQGQVATDPFDVLGAPTIEGDSGLVTSGLVSGNGFAGATVSVFVDGATAADCTSPVTAQGYWSCSLTVSSGPHTVQATQSDPDLGAGASSSKSGSLDLVVDKDAPDRPAVTSPQPGSRVVTQPVTYRGTGEAGSIVDLYIDNVPVCTSPVSAAGTWSCSASGTTNGSHSVLAVQRDSAGNYGQPSVPVQLFYGPAAGGTSPPHTPASPPGTPTAPGSPTPTPSSPGSSAPAPPSTPPDSGQPAQGGGDGWGTPTTFGATLPTLEQTVARGDWLYAPLVALGFILLVALPLRLLATALRGRIRMPSFALTGRNQAAAAEPEEPASPPRAANPWLAGILPLVVTACFIIASVGFTDQVRYLRLTLAIVLGLAIINVLAVALSLRLGSRFTRVAGRIRFLPILLVASAVAALLSRWTGISPPVVVGVLIGVGFAQAIPARSRAIMNLVEIGSVTLLALLAWLGHAWLGPVNGFWPSLASETLATIALAGLGSAIVLILPIATLPGRVLLEWSWRVWLVTVVVVTVIAAAVFLGGTGADFPVVGSLLAAGAFTAISLAVWSWLRYVEPASAG